MNIAAQILRIAELQPDKIALFHNENKRTYAELAIRVKKIAQGFKQNGYMQDKVAILSVNRIEFVEVFLGAVYAGCVPVPLDPKWSAAETNAIIQECDPRMIFAEQAYAQNLMMYGGEGRLITFSSEEKGSYDHWINFFEPETLGEVTNELLFIGFTSGTTGVPKGYMRSQLSWIKSFEATAEAFQFDRMEHITAPGPLVHSLSLFALVQSLISGATFHIVEHFDPHKLLKLCEKVPGMILFVVPTMIESMMQVSVSTETHIEALISSGGKWSAASKERAKEVFGDAKLYEFYGSSEASYISYIDVYAENKPNSVGRPFPGVEVSIRDEQFQEVPDGTSGQLYVRSDLIFSGYYGLPAETANVFRDGWLMLGDYISKDNDGYLYLAGRAKNMIVSGGLNIFPEEVESVLQRIPAIEEVMVLGVPDEYWGEKVAAVVKWNEKKRVTLEEIKNECRRYLASYKAPKLLFSVDHFIYTSSGKIARYAMKEYVKRVIE